MGPAAFPGILLHGKNDDKPPLSPLSPTAARAKGHRPSFPRLEQPECGNWWVRGCDS